MKNTIQIISYQNNRKEKAKESGVENISYSSFNNPDTLNKYHVNIIDLGDEDMWINNSEGDTPFSDRALSELILKDLSFLKTMIEGINCSNVVILVPQDIEFTYIDYTSYGVTETIRNYLSQVENTVKTLVPWYNEKLLFEKDITKLDHTKIESSFHFMKYPSSNHQAQTTSKYGEKITTINVGAEYQDEKVLITTLNLSDENKITDFLYTVNLFTKKEGTPTPEWINDINILNDLELKKQIDKTKERIEILNEELNQLCNEKKINNEYKEVLYESGSKLETRVKEIFEIILEVDLSEFKDKKKEDFLIKLDQVTFIGEVKGVKSNIRDYIISKLVNHYDYYIAELEDQGKFKNDVKPLLIVNHQREKSMNERLEVHENQIEKAKRDNVLIIETKTLLEILEKYISKELDSKEIIEIFKNEQGLLKLNDVKN